MSHLDPAPSTPASEADIYADMLLARKRILDKKFDPLALKAEIVKRCQIRMECAQLARTTHLHSFRSNDEPDGIEITMSGRSQSGCYLNLCVGLWLFPKSRATKRWAQRLRLALDGRERFIQRKVNVICKRIADEEAQIIANEGLDLPAGVVAHQEARELTLATAGAPGAHLPARRL
jgi:hypothetical protein